MPLLRWADRLAARHDDLARTITRATGKPLLLSRIEVDRAINLLRATHTHAQTFLAPRDVDLGQGSRATIHRVPIGPVLAISPFNFPLMLALHKLAPAIAAGCPATWKPSPKAPGVAELALELLDGAGVELVHWDNDETLRRAADPAWGLVSFTGSVAVGNLLKTACPSRLILELGGNAAVVLHQVADVLAMARTVATGACTNAGQACISVQRIFLPADRPDWQSALVAAFCAVPTGDPWDPTTICGPVIDAPAKARITALLEGYQARGGRILCGGTWDGLVLAPTLVAGLPAVDPGICAQEVFAPIATLHPYTDLGTALAEVDATPFGLQAGLYTQDPAVVDRAFARLQVGGLVINDVPTRRDDRLPYGGFRDSGTGREGAWCSVEDYTTTKVLYCP